MEVMEAINHGIPFAAGSSLQMIGLLNWVANLIGTSSPFTSIASNPLVWDTIKLLLLGSIIETGRKLFRWAMNQFQFRRSISAGFTAGNPTYEWLVSYLTEEGVWRMPHDFQVEIKSSQRKWKVDPGPDSHADFVPFYGSVQFFRWKGYLLEVTQSQNQMRGYDNNFATPDYDNNYYRPGAGPLTLTIYTRDVSVLFSFVEDCRLRYKEATKPHVTVHSMTTGPGAYPPGPPRNSGWGSVITKNRRPLDSLLLDGNKIETLLADAREFLGIEDWYINAGIPHRRGYLLHGPPGTGKTSTVYTMAGELGLEIYSVSLASAGLTDDQLSATVSRIPSRGILLIEDIDCAFPSREDEEDNMEYAVRPVSPYGAPVYHRSQITLSGLLNMLDGIGSEEGRLFFATTNHIDRLDPALLRPGRIDRKIEYKLASRSQAHALYCRFFPTDRFSDASRLDPHMSPTVQHVLDLDELADCFALAIPENEFNVAELQGYLLDWKTRPLDAARGAAAWVESERALKRERIDRKRLRRERIAATRAHEQMQANSAMIAGIGNAMAHGQRFGPKYPFGPPAPILLPANGWSLPDVDAGVTPPAIATEDLRPVANAEAGTSPVVSPTADVDP